MKTSLPLLAATTLSLLLAPLASAAKPLKVFILSGQSNMVGMGSVTTFPAIGMDPETAPLLKKMVDAEGNPVVCDNVYISMAAGSSDQPPKQGKLSVEYGGGKGVRIGPEFSFGIIMHELVGEPILIIKPAWGGKDLIRQFRPPSAGPYPISEEALAAMKAAGKDAEAAKAQREKDTGAYYKMMMEHIKKVLADPKSVYPDYDAAAGYELAGFVWFQGYNDYIGGAYPSTEATETEAAVYDFSEYTRLLGCFIRDIRKELAAPEMPFVVGVFGMGGKQADEKIQSFRKAQAATAELPEFKGNVVNVFTENYWPERIDQLKKQEFKMLIGTGKGKNRVFTELDGEAAKLREAIWAMKKGGDVSNKETEDEDAPKTNNKKNDVRESIQKQKDLMKKFHESVFTPEDVKLLEVGVSQQGYHYFGSAKFYAQAGKAFADAVPGISKTKP